MVGGLTHGLTHGDGLLLRMVGIPTPGAQSFSLYGKGGVPMFGLKAGHANCSVGVPMHGERVLLLMFMRLFHRMVQ